MKKRTFPFAFAFITALMGISGCNYVPDLNVFEEEKPAPLEGSRITVMRADEALEPDTDLAQTDMQLAPAAAHEDWPQHGGGILPGVWHPSFPENVTVRENVAIGEGDAFPYHMVISPVVANGTVYAMDGMGLISAHAVASPEEARWISKGVSHYEEEPVLGGGLAVEGSRLIATSGKGAIAALDTETGNVLWRQEVYIPIRSAPRIADNIVYVVTIDSQFFALSLESGEILWQHRGIDEDAGFLIEATPTAVSDIVVAPYTSGEIHVLYTGDGSPLWSDVLIAPRRTSASSVFIGIGGDPVIADGIVYAGSSSGVTTAIVLQNGRRIWERPIGTTNTAWVSGDYVFVLSNDSTLYSLYRRDGRIRWRTPLKRFDDAEDMRDPVSWYGPVLAGNALWLVAADGWLVSVNPANGDIIKETEIPEGIHMAPVIAGDAMYLIDQDASLHILR